MIQGHRTRARFACAVITFAAVGAAGATFAAPADAALRGVAIGTPAGYGSSNGSTNYDVYGAGCTYELDVVVDNPKTATSNLKVTSSVGGRSVTIYDAKPTTSVVKPKWRPTAPGRYMLSATLDGVTKTRAVNVGTGVQFPDFIRSGACFVVPIY
ncbi:hypothetical protein AAFP35_24210 [Gordonia sp. CPCC 206044]|uniref:hypothetical protein n=1 Tax=Gordonia sp. CPCC 206044 TaxID=3140793 RepID=UPI003AF37B6D